MSEGILQSARREQGERAARLRLPDLSAQAWRALLMLLTLAVVLASYAASTPLSVNIGGDADQPYLAGFNDPELTLGQPQRRVPWPAGEQSLVLDAVGQDDQLVLVETEQVFGERLPLSLAVQVDGQGVLFLPRRTGEPGFLVVVPRRLVEDGRFTLWVGESLSHTSTPTPITLRAAVVAPQRSYRWSTTRSSILLPGVGPGSWLVDLQGVVQHPGGQPVEASLWANGQQLARLPEGEQRRRFLLIAPAEGLDGDLELEITANTFRDPRELGVLTEDLRIVPLERGGRLPAPWLLLAALLLMLGVDMALTLAGRPVAQRALAAALLLGAGGWVLTAYRFPMTIYLPRLLLMVGLSVLLLALLRRALPWLFRRGGVEIGATALNLLLLLFLAGFWLKAGGMLYPYMTAIDVEWHMDKVRRILNGELAELYKPGAFNESVMPIGEWGEERPVIPYSPFFHIFSTIFALLPWRLELSANVFSAIIDNSRVFILFFIARRVGLSERAGLIAAVLYAVLPAPFLLHSWGNIPTTFGMWWGLLCMAFILGAWGRLHRPPALIALTLLLTTTMLFYSVVAVFMGLILLLWLPLLAWLAPVEQRVPRQVPAIAGALLGATALATLIYYGQYIDQMIERTLPYMLRGGSETLRDQYEPFGSYLAAHIPRLVSYGLLIPLLLTPIGIALAWRRQRMLALWSIPVFAIALLFVVLARSISMTDKHIFFLIPVLALGAAVVLEKLWTAHVATRALALALYAYLAIAAVNLWIFRIETV